MIEQSLSDCLGLRSSLLTGMRHTPGLLNSSQIKTGKVDFEGQFMKRLNTLHRLVVN